jgi:cysteinyl-tRNA synthetase
MYVCGPTVYDFAHIGNARPVVVFDTLYRVLQRLYPRVVYVRNITDVDDKIIAAALQNGEPMESLTARYTAAFQEDMAALNALPPTVEPRATAHIKDMIRLIQTLLARGHAYVAAGEVLFDTASMKDYGQLSRRTSEALVAGMRVEVAAHKRNPGDFVLWKPSEPGEPAWDSPWGAGRPGWHIECSAMAEAHLGLPVDIHGGGQDLIFPHHENEIAQSCCAHPGADYVHVWMHNGFITVNGHKMSKSLGNFLTVRQAREQGVPGEVIRYVLLAAHYRQPVDWSDAAVANARSNLDRLYTALRQTPGIVPAVEPDADFLAALLDDLNTPMAFARLHELAGDLNKAADERTRAYLKGALLASAALVGLLQTAVEHWFKDGAEVAEDYIDALIAERNAARKARDFAAADRIRQTLLEQGIVLEDAAGGTVWRRK